MDPTGFPPKGRGVNGSSKMKKSMESDSPSLYPRRVGSSLRGYKNNPVDFPKGPESDSPSLVVRTPSPPRGGIDDKGAYLQSVYKRFVRSLLRFGSSHYTDPPVVLQRISSPVNLTLETFYLSSNDPSFYPLPIKSILLSHLSGHPYSLGHTTPVQVCGCSSKGTDLTV